MMRERCVCPLMSPAARPRCARPTNPAGERWSNSGVLRDQIKTVARQHRRPARAVETSMSVWVLLAVNSIALGGLLFLLSAGFSLIFGLMRIPNLMHGSF